MATTTPSGVWGAGERGGARNAAPARPSATPAGAAPMTHRQIMEALSGLLLGLFVAILSSTIVSNALPRIVSDLGGSQSSYTWVVTATLLTMTASTPLWGKLADLVSKKALVQTAIVIFVFASASAGFAQNTTMLIASRAVQGVGMGGISALAQIVIAAMISPRERGRYTGYIGASYAVAMVSGPLLGGVITDTGWLGWRWCFYVGIPFAVVAMLLLQKTLRLPLVKRHVKVDFPGALLVAAATSLLLIWVTFAGHDYDWLSWQTYAMVGGSLALALLFVLVESKVSEPIIPLRLFRNRTITLAALTSLFVGIAMFSATVYLSQYFQLARGQSPTMAGVMTIPMIGGLFLASTLSGQVISRTGRWKVWLCTGGVLLTAGLGLLVTLRHDTPYWRVAVCMAAVGVGIGMMMQNLVLATQNQVRKGDLGSTSSTVNFFRTLGGAAGVAVLGAVLSDRLKDYATDGLHRIGVSDAGAAGTGGAVPNLAKLPAPVRGVIETAYGHGIGDIYIVAAPCALLALLLVLFIKEVPLRTKPVSAAQADGSPATTPATANADAAQTAPAAQGEAAAAGTGAPLNDVRPQPSWARAEHGGGQPGAQDQFAAGALTATAYDTAYDPAPEPAGSPQHQRGGYGVRGIVRSADGSGVPRAAVTLISLNGRQLGRSVTHANGGYGLEAPSPGSYVLIAAADGHQPQASTVVIGDEPLDHDILLSGTNGLAGQVRSSVDGLPVSGAMVIVADVRGEVLATGKTGGRGDFRFGELTAGTFTLAVNAPGFRPTARPVEVSGQGVTQADVQLAAGARVQGVIRAGAERAPLADARVTLVDAAGNVIATSTTGDDGAYAFTDLDAGDYSVIASGYPPVAHALNIDESGVEGHHIELHHPNE
jgi:EmrB/QacA subfamily drug resistance transporter